MICLLCVPKFTIESKFCAFICKPNRSIGTFPSDSSCQLDSLNVYVDVFEILPPCGHSGVIPLYARERKIVHAHLHIHTHSLYFHHIRGNYIDSH